MVNKNQKDYLKDLAIYSGGAVTGMLVDAGVANLYAASGLPVVGIGTLKIDDMLLLAAEGLGGYYLYKKNKKDLAKFVMSMFAMTVAIEVGEAIMSAMPTAATYIRSPQTTRYVIA